MNKGYQKNAPKYKVAFVSGNVSNRGYKIA